MSDFEEWFNGVVDERIEKIAEKKITGDPETKGRMHREVFAAYYFGMIDALKLNELVDGEANTSKKEIKKSIEEARQNITDVLDERHRDFVDACESDPHSFDG